MTTRKIIIRNLATFILLLIVPGFAEDTTAVQHISSREYFQVVSREINNAQHSIHVVMYLFSIYPNSPQSKTMQLADALVSAQKRGVNVEIVMDKNDFSKNHADPEEAGDNRLAYDYLTSRGLHACFADVPAVVHAKAVIIDSETVILGSANWSESAFEKNVEASALFHSRTFASQALAELGKLPVKTLPAGDSVFVNVPLAFMSDSEMGRMVTSQDERAFDTYLFLSNAGRGGKDTFAVDNDTLAHYLGISSMTREEYRRQISKTLTKLADRYKLIVFNPQYNGDSHIEIAKASSPSAVAIPESYFKYGWRNRLDFPAKAMYVLSLYYSSVSLSKPQWSMAAQTIAQRHGLSRWFVSEGITALRRANLLDVIFDKVPQGSDTLHRHASIYFPLTMYDPAVLDSAWARLENRYGKEKTSRARQCAGLVYKDCDFRAVEQFISLEEKYGLEKMQKAEKIIGEKSPDNPRRTVGYFIATVISLK